MSNPDCGEIANAAPELEIRDSRFGARINQINAPVQKQRHGRFPPSRTAIDWLWAENGASFAPSLHSQSPRLSVGLLR